MVPCSVGMPRPSRGLFPEAIGPIFGDRIRESGSVALVGGSWTTTRMQGGHCLDLITTVGRRAGVSPFRVDEIVDDQHLQNPIDGSGTC